jgi:hypothetical protein
MFTMSEEARARRILERALVEDFGLTQEIAKLAREGRGELAAQMNALGKALTAKPMDWDRAISTATFFADQAYPDPTGLERFRHHLHRALLAIMFDLPQSVGQMLLAKQEPNSMTGAALSAAAIAAIFAEPFEQM